MVHFRIWNKVPYNFVLLDLTLGGWGGGSRTMWGRGKEGVVHGLVSFE